MCYTTTTHFTRCSHRTSTINFCPRSTQLRPTIYHPQTHHVRPCEANSREDDIFIQRDGLCKTCSRVSFWFAGGGGGRVEDFTRRDGSRRRKDRVPTAAQMAGGSPYHHPRATQGRAVSSDRTGPAYPVPTGVQAGHCPLSEAFERAVKIGGDEDSRVEGARWVSDGMGERAGVDGAETRRQKGEYGPFRPPRFSPGAHNAGGGLHGGGMPSWPGGHGGHARRTAGRTAGRKQVRFAPKVEVLYFRRDWATRTLRSLSREYKGRR